MSDLEGSYAPQSPDLSEYQTYQSEPSPPSFGRFAYVPPTNYTPQSSYHQNQQHLARPSYTSSPTQMPRRTRTTDSEGDGDIVPGASTLPNRGRKPKKPKIEAEEKCEKPAPGVEEGVEVKTKFPVARIKRIMQADEDVGKVAQVTPTAVSKALELFMISIVTKAADIAKSKQAKKVTAAHLKQVVSDVEAFDFLKDIVSKVADAPAAKKEDDSEEGPDAKKKKTRARRKVKSEEED